MERLKRWWQRWKAKHWEENIEILEKPDMVGVFQVIPPLRARWKAVKPHLKRWLPDIAVGVLAGIITTFLLRLFGL